MFHGRFLRSQWGRFSTTNFTNGHEWKKAPCFAFLSDSCEFVSFVVSLLSDSKGDER